MSFYNDSLAFSTSRRALETEKHEIKAASTIRNRRKMTDKNDRALIDAVSAAAADLPQYAVSAANVQIVTEPAEFYTRIKVISMCWRGVFIICRAGFGGNKQTKNCTVCTVCGQRPIGGRAGAFECSVSPF